MQAGRLEVKWLETSAMPADGLTKPLPPQKHSAFVRQLGLVEINVQNAEVVCR